MTRLSKITMVGQADISVSENCDCRLSFSILFCDGRVLSGEEMDWRSELARNVDPEEVETAINRLAQTTSVVKNILHANSRVRKHTTLEVEFAYGEVVETRLTCDGKYMEYESFDVLEQLW